MAKLLKFRYAPRIAEQFYKETPISTRLQSKTDPEDFSGKNIVIAAHYQRSEAVGARGELGVLPTPQYQKIENMTVGVAFLYGKIKLSRPLIKSTRDNMGAFARAMKLEVDGIKESLLFDGARQMVYGDGTGKLAATAVPGAATLAAGASLTVTAGTGFVTDHIRVGMILDGYNPSVVVEFAGVEVTAVTATTFTIKNNLSTGQTYTNVVHSWYRTLAKDVEMMGLGGVIDDGTRVATFQGLARSSNTWLKANVLANGGTNRSLTLDLMDSAFFESAKNGGGSFPTAIYARYAAGIKYAAVLRTQRQFQAPIMNLDGGFKVVEYTGPGGTAPIILGRTVRPNEIWFVNEPDLARWEMTPVEFVEEDGNMWQRALDGTDAFEAVLATYQQMGATRCNNCTALKDITEAYRLAMPLA